MKHGQWPESLVMALSGIIFAPMFADAFFFYCFLLHILFECHFSPFRERRSDTRRSNGQRPRPMTAPGFGSQAEATGGRVEDGGASRGSKHGEPRPGRRRAAKAVGRVRNRESVVWLGVHLTSEKEGLLSVQAVKHIFSERFQFGILEGSNINIDNI